MKKKLIIMIFILLLLLIVSCKKEEIIEKDHYLTLRIKPDQDIKYSLELNNSELKSGNLAKDLWEEIKIKNLEGKYVLYYWNDEYYIDYIEETPQQNQDITRTIELNLKKEKLKGNISISFDKELIISSNNTVEKFSYCIYRTIGFLKAEPIKDVSFCEEGWKNHTKTYNLTENKYYCDNYITRCDETLNDQCFNEELIIPRIYADRCYFVGKTLINENFTIPLMFDTVDYFDENDYLEITIIDMELTKKNSIDGIWGYGFDEDLGIEDFTQKLYIYKKP